MGIMGKTLAEGGGGGGDGGGGGGGDGGGGDGGGEVHPKITIDIANTTNLRRFKSFTP